MSLSIVENIDCMIRLREAPDNHWDLAICDPPYGIDYAKRTAKTSTSVIRYVAKDWDSHVPTDEYFTELFRVSSNQIIFGGNYFKLPPTRGFAVWDKCQPEQLDQAMCEYIWTSFDTSAKFHRTSIQQIQFTRIHPTEKPIPLYKWLLGRYAKPGDTILDTHLGSQSSRIAAWDLGFDFTGFELDEDYFKAGCERFEIHKAQARLFENNVEPVLQAYQSDLFGTE